MHPETAWAIYFSGVLSLKFHPKNSITDETEAVQHAARIADIAMIEHHKRFYKWHGEQSQQPQSAQQATPTDSQKPTAPTSTSTEKTARGRNGCPTQQCDGE